MAKKQSFQDIVNRIARRLSALQADRPYQLGFLSAIDAFLAVDSLLAQLHKQYKDALKYSEKLVRLRGPDDPMAGVAADMADSAKSAFQTRLIEVRHDRWLRKAALKLLRQNRALLQRERKKRDIFTHVETLAMQNRHRPSAQARQEGEESFIRIMFLLSMLQNTLRHTHKMLSLASAFENASTEREIHAA
jgi:hypothetical protein